ncbi:MAG: 50S ribosomal protein L21 [Candidatus Obscuribacterales bacterium]|jgi:large subunit ribosomal protein L21|nr:50S ribosomal protein L21 [Cyanobacteria bacterium SZAS LIN-5]RTL41156.1 MAG: 50S ribosomal protein L21 [Candidatus Melainabacteria bacterium]
MFAIVEACGRQYQLEAGRFVDVDLTEGEAGTAFVFDKILMIVDGANSTLGAPFIEGAKVSGKILSHHKTKKVIVYHMKPKKGTRKKQGHRQHYTRILIDTIELKDKVLAKAEERQGKPAKAADKTAAEPKKAKAAEKKPAEKKAAPKASEKKSKS